MTKRKDQPIKPGWRPSGEEQNLSELENMLRQMTFLGGIPGKPIPLDDSQKLICIALQLWKEGRVPSYNQAYTVACTAYWRMFDK